MKKWIYIIDKQNRDLFKIYENPEVAYKELKSTGIGIISTKQKSNHCETWKIYK